jgi:hypothetical protein
VSHFAAGCFKSAVMMISAFPLGVPAMVSGGDGADVGFGNTFSSLYPFHAL